MNIVNATAKLTTEYGKRYLYHINIRTEHSLE